MPDATARPSVWTRPERGERGPVPGHSREAIVDAAVAIADADGVAAVSMRAVAAALGTGPGTLYRYLSSRDDLLDLMTDRVVGGLRPYPRTDGPWVEAMLTLARAQLALFRRHRWLVDVVHRPTAVGPEGLAWFDECLRVLAATPATGTDRFQAIALMTGVAALFARSGPEAEGTAFPPLDLAPYPHLVAAMAGPPGPADPEELFDRAIRILLVGLLDGG